MVLWSLRRPYRTAVTAVTHPITSDRARHVRARDRGTDYRNTGLRTSRPIQQHSRWMRPWLDDDDNLTKWEDNSLTASDRRILLATWHFRACKRALQGEAKRKYFEHAGALLTADGTDDDLIKFEGAPAGYKVKL